MATVAVVLLFYVLLNVMPWQYSEGFEGVKAGDTNPNHTSFVKGAPATNVDDPTESAAVLEIPIETTTQSHEGCVVHSALANFSASSFHTDLEQTFNFLDTTVTGASSQDFTNDNCLLPVASDASTDEPKTFACTINKSEQQRDRTIATTLRTDPGASIGGWDKRMRSCSGRLSIESPTEQSKINAMTTAAHLLTDSGASIGGRDGSDPPVSQFEDATWYPTENYSYLMGTKCC